MTDKLMEVDREPRTVRELAKMFQNWRKVFTRLRQSGAVRVSGGSQRGFSGTRFATSRDQACWVRASCVLVSLLVVFPRRQFKALFGRHRWNACG